MNFEKFKKIQEDRPNFGEIDEPDAVGVYHNESCGDDYCIHLEVDDGVIRDARFTTTGCGFGLAAISIACDLLEGRTIEEAETVTWEEISEGVDGFPPRRLHYPKVARVAIQEAIDDYKEKAELAAAD